MRRRVVVMTVALIIAGVVFTSLALASHGGYHLDWWTADGGGVVGMESGDGSYTLSGTAGQPDAGTLASGDGSYTLAGGFWAGGEGVGHNVFIPVVIK